MLRLFSTVRKNYIAEGHLTRYFWYALGEVLLVMVGILLALQANDWYEGQVNAKAEARYVTNLQRDLELQIEEIDNQINASKVMYGQISEVVKAFAHSGNITVDQALLANISAIVDRRTFTIKDPTYTALLSTGNLELLRNEEFKDHLIKYYQRLERVETIIQKNNDSKDTSILPLAFTLTETIGPQGFIPELFIDGSRIPATIRNATADNLQINIINQLLQEPKNKLTLINLVRYRHALLYSDMDMLSLMKSKTNDLVSSLEHYYD